MTKPKPKADSIELIRPGVCRLVAGERRVAEEMIRRTRWYPETAVGKLLEARGAKLTNVGASSTRVDGVACPKCGATTETSSGLGIMRVEYARRWHTGANAHSNSGDSVICLACHEAFGAPELIHAIWKPTQWVQKAKFLEPWRTLLEPPEVEYTFARYGDDGKTVFDRNAIRAIKEVLPVQHDCTIQLCRVLAKFEPIELSTRADELPWATVAISPKGVPDRADWDGLPPRNPDEAKAIAERVGELRARKVAEVEAEVSRYRQKLMSEIQ